MPFFQQFLIVENLMQSFEQLFFKQIFLINTSLIKFDTKDIKTLLIQKNETRIDTKK